MKITTPVLRAAFLASTGLSLAAIPQLAMAQDAAEDAAQVDDSVIIVTATKREQTLQDVPVAVSVTSADTIEKAQIRDLIDLQTVVPTLRVSQLQSSANTNFIIRGFGNGANNPGIEPSVGVFIDGVYRSRSAAQVGDLPTLQRIEVLRGPQSTLFGKNASAGIISIVTKEPSFEFGGSAELTYGNYNAIVAKADITGPITETIAFSLAGGINKRDGYVRDLNQNSRTNERDRWYTRAQLLFEPSDDFKLRIIGDYDKIDEVCCAAANLVNGPTGAVVNALAGGLGLVAQDPFSYQVRYNFPSSNKIENYGISGQMDYQLGDFSLTSITAYREVHTNTNQDSDFTAADLIGSNVGNVDIETFTQEVRLASDLDGPVNFLLGGFYFDEKVSNLNSLTFGKDFRNYINFLTNGGLTTLETQVLGLPLNTFSRQGVGVFDDFQMDNTSYSIFGTVDFEISDDLTFTGGLNYTKDRKDVVSNVVSTDAFSALNLTAIGQQVITSQGIATTVGNLLGLGRLATAAEVGGFAQGNPAAFAQVQAGSAAFAAANASNPAVNPLLGLAPLQFLPPFLNIPNAVENGKTRDSDWSYTARLAWDINDTLNAYVSYATGFKASSFNLSRDSRPLAGDLAAIRAAGIATPNLISGSRFAGAEDSTVYEAGLKAKFDYASFNLAVFQQEIKGFQSNIFTGTGFALANAGKQSTFGIEFEGQVNPIEALTLSVAMVYLDPIYDSFPNSSTGDLSGTQPAGIPELSATLAASYDHEFASGDHLIVRGDYHYESKVEIIENVPGFQREVNNISASMTYAMDMGLEFTLWGRNLGDSQYLIQVFPAVVQSGSVSGYPNQPRTYGATVRYKF